MNDNFIAWREKETIGYEPSEHRSFRGLAYNGALCEYQLIELSAEEKMSINRLPDKVKELYRSWSYAEAAVGVIFFTVVLLVAWVFTRGVPESKLLALHPRELVSIPAILLSNFFHKDFTHLFGNLLFFVPLGFWVFKQEGMRGFLGILVGMLVAGVATWVFGERVSSTVGFSGAVFACVGILLVRSIRESVLQTVVFLVLLYFFLEDSLFETIRPTVSTEKGNISWLGHLGGLIGGMMVQIRSIQIALEMLHKQDHITEEEFITIANRIGESGELFFGEPKSIFGESGKTEEQDTETPQDKTEETLQAKTEETSEKGNDNSNNRITP